MFNKYNKPDTEVLTSYNAFPFLSQVRAGVVPTTFELDNNEKDDMKNDSVIRDSKFPPGYERPDLTNRDIEKYNGILLKNLANRIGE